MKGKLSTFSLVAVLAITCLPSAFAQQPQGQPVRTITQITGDLYRVPE